MWPYSAMSSSKRVLLLFCLFTGNVLFCQTSNFRFTSYSINEGLSSNNILNIFQDFGGYIWVCTQDGFNKFDGIHFKKYQRRFKTTNTITSLNIKQLYEDRDDWKAGRRRLWVLTSSGGISVLNLRTDSFVQHIRSNPAQQRHSLFSDRTRRLIKTSDGNYWIASNGGLSVYDPWAREFLPFTSLATKDLSAIESNTLAEDDHCRVWVGTYNQGILVFDVNTRRLLYRISPEQLAVQPTEEYGIQEIVKEGKTILWVCTGNGLRKIVLDAQGNYSIQLKPFESAVLPVHTINTKCLLKDRRGNYWIGTTQGLLHTDGSFKQQTLIVHDPASQVSLINNRIQSLFEDNRGAVWIGTFSGVSKYDPLNQKFNTYEKDPVTGQKIDAVYGVFTDNDEELFACTRFGLLLINKITGRVKAVNRGERTHPTTYYHVFRHTDGNILAGSGDGIYVLTKAGDAYVLNDPERYYPELKSVKGNSLNAHCYLNDSLLAFGSDYKRDGLIVWNLRSHKVDQYKPVEGDSTSLLDEYITFIYKDRDGAIWCGTDIGVAKFDVGKRSFKNYHTAVSGVNTLNSKDIYDCYDDGSRLWFATYGGGLNIFDKQTEKFTAITQEDGLCANTLYCILPDSSGHIWVSSNFGLSRVTLSNRRILNYYYEDGLQSNAFDNYSACKYGETLYFGGMNGITEINPHALRLNNVPSPVFTQVSYSINSQLFYVAPDWRRELTIDRRQDIVTFEFTALNYTNAQKNRYVYKLEGYDKQWIDNGPNTKAIYTNLPPGHYRFRVKVTNDDNVWNEAGIGLPVYIEPWFFQTLWFKILAVLLFIGCVYLLYRYRVAQLLRMERLRRKISEDLHDDIGSTLNSVKVFTNLAMMRPEHAPAYLQQSKEGIQSAIVGVRDMVWVLDDKQDSIYHLVERVEQFISPIASAQDIRFEKFIDPSLADRMLSKEEKRNLYMIIKEALNNSVKYAEASVISLRLEKQGSDKYSIIIHDNGKGFDVDAVKRGNGLNNIAYRSKQIRYALAIDGAPGKGASISLARL